MIRLVRGWMRGDCWVPTLRHLKKASIQLGQSRFSFFAGRAMVRVRMGRMVMKRWVSCIVVVL